jgi:hypothetical protein
MMAQTNRSYPASIGADLRRLPRRLSARPLVASKAIARAFLPSPHSPNQKHGPRNFTLWAQCFRSILN